MGLFNFIKESLNPQISERFDYLYSHYKAGVEAYVSSHNNMRIPGYNYTPNRIVISSNMSYDDKKTIVEAESLIIALDQAHHKAIEDEKKKKAVTEAAKKYKYGFYVLCKKYLSEYRIINAPIMPGAKKSMYAKRQEEARKKNEQTSTPRISVVSNSFDPLISQRIISKYGSASKTIDCSKWEFSEWALHIINTLYPHLSKFETEDKKIVSQLEIENTNCDYEDKVLDNSIRSKFVSAFLKSRGRNTGIEIEKRKFILSNLSTLDRYADNELTNACADLASAYPNGYAVFKRKFPSLSKLDILKRESEICEFEINFESASVCENWESEQREYYNFCRNKAKEVLSGYGNYGYDIPTEKIDFTGLSKATKIHVRQQFNSSYCEELDLDYLGDMSYLNNAAKIEDFNDCSRHFYDRVYEKIFEFIKQIHSRYKNLIVVFGSSGLKENKDQFLKYHFAHLTSLLKDNQISFSYDFKIFPREYRHIIIVEIHTTNSVLIENCQKLISSNEGIYPFITYVSLYKRYDRNEMIDILNREKQKIEAEKKKREEEQKRLNERKSLIQRLQNATRSWNTPTYSSVKYFSLYYYYPTTCDWNASEDEWDIRNLIWNFKANPRKPTPEAAIMSSHRTAVSEIKPDLCRAIRHFFGSDVGNLTLVCIPSSSKVVTRRRYEDFAETICRELGMINAYNHIEVVSDGEAKHLGGNGKALYSFDKDFFKDKLVLLFDDVITSGESMARFANSLEKLGATVIGGMSIGKTKHERQGLNPIDRL